MAGGSAASPSKAGKKGGGKPKPTITVESVLKASNHYKVLKLQPDVVRKAKAKKAVAGAFKRACLRVHPDKVSHARADEAFVKLREAYRVLSDPALRAAYDDELTFAKLEHML